MTTSKTIYKALLNMLGGALVRVSDGYITVKNLDVTDEDIALRGADPNLVIDIAELIALLPGSDDRARAVKVLRWWKVVDLGNGATAEVVGENEINSTEAMFDEVLAVVKDSPWLDYVLVGRSEKVIEHRGDIRGRLKPSRK